MPKRRLHLTGRLLTIGALGVVLAFTVAVAAADASWTARMLRP